MKITYSWIRSYVPELNVSAEEFADRMTMAGTKVTGFDRTDSNLKNIVVGQIVKRERHPYAPELYVYQVNTGSRQIQVVSKAAYLNPGDKVPVALEGGRIVKLNGSMIIRPDGINVQKGSIRGVESEGILCSVDELGFSREEATDEVTNGVYVFPADTAVGADAVEELGLSDVIFTFEPASARKDCYRVLGIAREAAAVFGKKFVEPSVEVKANGEDITDYLKVKVHDGVICQRYCARVVKNVQLGPSPHWMQQRLISCGIRPVNQLVDITNYVMEEYGQPILAFDLDSLAGHEIHLEHSEDGNKFRTLDGQWRNVGAKTLMLCDAQQPFGIAGIMGGERTKVEENGHTIVLEAACFDGAYIRRATKRLNLTTEISRRFARGLDANYAEEGLNRACQLMEELGCGEVVGGMIDECSTVVGTRRIEFHPDWINHHLGTSIPREEMLGYLYSLGFQYDEESGDLITPPGRQDIMEEAEVAGEVVRLYGYDNVPITIPRVETTRGQLPLRNQLEDTARRFAEFNGYSQIMTNPMEDPAVFDRLRIPDRDPLRNVVRIQNPLDEEHSIMRTQSVHGMLEVLGTNAANRHRHVRLYELSNVYLPRNLERNELPEERMQLTFGTYNGDDFFALKGLLQGFLHQVGMPVLRKMDGIGLHTYLEFKNEQARNYLHPGRQAEIYYGTKKIGFIGEVHPKVSESYGIADRVYLAVLDMQSILLLRKQENHYHELNRYAKVVRDLSVLTQEHVTAASIEANISRVAGEQLENLEMACPVYRGSGLPAGTKSVTYHLRFQAADHDITGPEVQQAMERIRRYLEDIGISVKR